MKRIVASFSLSLASSSLLWLASALPGHAFTAELVSITPDATDISDQMQTGGDAPEGMAMFGWMGTVDEAYTAVFSVDETPAMVVTPGASMSTDSPWSYDADAGTVTVDFTLKGIVGSDSFVELPEGSGIAIVALVPAATDQSGPPAEMTGGWFATNLQDWTIIPPSPENPAFGFELTGDSGTVGFFRMFLPGTLIDLLSEYSGETLEVSDLAVFNGDYQSSMSVTEVNGGAFIDINVTFTDARTTVSSTTDVTKSIKAAPRLPVSLSPSKTSLNRGSTEKLYGWINTNQANKTVTIYRKRQGEDTYTVWKTVETNSNGYFKTSFEAKKTARYKAKYHGNTSEVIKVTVN